MRIFSKCQHFTERAAGIIILAWFLTGIARAETAEDLVQKAEDLLRGLTSTGTYTMIVTRPSWTRRYTIRFWDQREGDKSFVVIEEPVRDRGTAFLKLKNDMWMYIPRVERIIRIPPSMMMNSWMGSDFTNDDLVKESSISRDYDKTILERKRRGKYTTYTLQLTPKPDAPVVWGKIVYTLKIPGHIPVRAEYYNERGELIRYMTFERVRKMGGVSYRRSCE